MDEPTEGDRLKDDSHAPEHTGDDIIDRPDIQRLFLILALALTSFALATIDFGSRGNVTADVNADDRSPTTGFRINVNQASATELSLLPQVGPVLAKRIVAEREAHGPFLSVSDLARTTGIGPDRIARLRPLVVTDY